ncbi:MAG: hypothetical protein ABL903_01755 [Methylococcales bacterium]
MHSLYSQITVDKAPRDWRLQLKDWLPKLAIGIWGGMVVVVGAFLMADHWVTLPLPSGDDQALARAIDDSRNLDEQGQWLAVHILYSKCTCSKRIVEHLFSKARTGGIKEKLLIVDGDRPEWLASAKAKGFSYEVISPKTLHEFYNVSAAPMMVVADPLGKVRYAGGYTARKQGPDIKDVEIIQQLMTEHPVKPIPLFGCAVAKGLQVLADPFGLKY